MDKEFELKLANGSVTSWHGYDGLNAAERYEDVFPEDRVIAWRPIRHGLFIGAPGPGSDR